MSEMSERKKDNGSIKSQIQTTKKRFNEISK